MGATRESVNKELKLPCGCWYVYSPDRFVSGERQLECTKHGKVWKIRAVKAVTTYEVDDVTPPPSDDT